MVKDEVDSTKLARVVTVRQRAKQGCCQGEVATPRTLCASPMLFPVLQDSRLAFVWVLSGSLSLPCQEHVFLAFPPCEHTLLVFTQHVFLLSQAASVSSRDQWACRPRLSLSLLQKLKSPPRGLKRAHLQTTSLGHKWRRAGMEPVVGRTTELATQTTQSERLLLLPTGW